MPPRKVRQKRCSTNSNTNSKAKKKKLPKAASPIRRASRRLHTLHPIPTVTDRTKPSTTSPVEDEGTRDTLRLVSADGMTSRVQWQSFQRSSSFAMGLTRSGMRELFTGLMRLPFSQKEIKPVLNYVNNGKCRFEEIGDISALLKVADYLGMDGLIDDCATFLLPRIADAPLDYLAMANRFSARRLRNEVLQYLSTDVRFIRDTHQLAKALTVDEVADLLRSDKLAVNNEDETCNIFLSWWNHLAERGQTPDAEKANRVVNALRLGILSAVKARKLCEAIDACGFSIPALEECRSGNFSHLSSEQIRRRENHSWHLHVLWAETLVHPNGFRRTAISCLKTYNDRHESVSSVQGRRSTAQAFTRQILDGAMSELCELLTSSDALNDRRGIPSHLVVGQDIVQVIEIGSTEFDVRTLQANPTYHNFRWREQFRLFRSRSQGHTAVTSEGSSRCVISWLHPEGGYRFVCCDLQSFSVDYEWQAFPYVPGSGDLTANKSIRELDLGDDIVVCLFNRGLSLFRKETAGSAIEVQFDEIDTFVSMARIGNLLFVYEDRGSRVGVQSGSKMDRLHIINLTAGVVNDVVDVNHDVEVSDMDHTIRPGRVRHLQAYQNELILILQEDGLSTCNFLRFDPCAKCFRSFAAVPLQRQPIINYLGAVFCRRFLTLIPVNLQKCTHSCWMYSKINIPRRRTTPGRAASSFN